MDTCNNVKKKSKITKLKGFNKKNKNEVVLLRNMRTIKIKIT